MTATDTAPRAIEAHGMTPALWDTVDQNRGLIADVLNTFGIASDDYPWDDAWQDGYLGLIRAAQKYDPALGYAFSTYAYRWIRQYATRGRDAVKGSGYRRWRDTGGAAAHGPWKAPLSLDVHPRGDNGAPVEGSTIGENLPHPDPDDHTDTGYVEWVRTALYAYCADGLDRDIVDSLVDGRTVADAAHAKTHNVTRAAAHNRRRRLIAIARHPHTGLNPAAWARRAACLGTPGNLWFPTRGTAKSFDDGRALCASCPVADTCHATRTPSHPGLRAGIAKASRTNVPTPAAAAA